MAHPDGATPIERQIAELVGALAMQQELSAQDAALLALRLRDVVAEQPLALGLAQDVARAGGETAQVPAVKVEDSVRPQFLVCLETGEKTVLLRRHLAERLKMTPEEYRRKWGLPPEYPMVAERYSARRAAASGLGGGA